jgi:Spy/CpxP family protein refolding chaperone
VPRSILCLALLAAASAVAAQPTPASLSASPAARQILERDWVLMNWALKFYDRDHDILLSPAEAQAAADQFRKMADADGDGRVTPQEYRDARAYILARY